MSSDKVEGEERMVGRQAITLRTGERGVSMIRKEMEGGESEYGLDGLGLMDGLGQEELRVFATMWVMVVHRGLMEAMGKVEGAQVLADGGIAAFGDFAAFL